MKERDFQRKVIKGIKKALPGCIVLKTDPNYIQGFPDLLILHEKQWGALEVKRSERASRQPNQEFYIRRLDNMSWARFIYPENEREIMYEIQSTFGAAGAACVSKSKQQCVAQLRRGKTDKGLSEQPNERKGNGAA